MSDQQITCAECGNIFVFSAAEQQFYAERQLAAPPKRCKACRQARRAAQGDGGGRGPSRDRGPRPGGGGPGDYRSPSGNGFGGGAGGGRFAPRGGAGGGGFGNGAPPRGDRGAPRGNRPPRPGGFGGGGGFNGNARDAAPARPQGESSWGTRPNEGGQRPPRPSRDRAPAAPYVPKPNERAPGTRPERPKYDITCAECGTQAQVPFKPLEGRQVFCQPCYKARKAPPEAEANAATTDTDTGIVE